jgi:hypothetical protein
MRQVTTGGGMVSCASLVQHFGIGEVTVIDSVILYWPMTKDLYRQVDRYYNVQANQRISYTQLPKSAVSATKKEENKLLLYPSVASSTITIRGALATEDTKYEILSLLGESVATFYGKKDEVELPVSTLSAGQYFVKVSTSTSTRAVKFIKIVQ